MITIARVYGYNKIPENYSVLVDRLWPRGIRKDSHLWDEWMPDLAPSHELRKWFHHDSERFDEFRIHYFRELEGQQAAVTKARQLEQKSGTLVLLYAAHDPEINHARILREFLCQAKL
ncbi:MAG: DUF488 domain-containing protein [Draconibacterium sp.]